MKYRDDRVAELWLEVNRRRAEAQRLQALIAQQTATIEALLVDAERIEAKARKLAWIRLRGAGS